MQLAPPAEGYYEHTSLDLLIKQINEHAKNEGYAITRKRSKPSKLGILMKAVLRCDRGGRWLDWGDGVNEKVGFFVGILRPVPKFGVLGEYCAQRRAQKVRATSRVQGWCASKVRWCVGSGCLFLSACS